MVAMGEAAGEGSVVVLGDNPAADSRAVGLTTGTGVIPMAGLRPEAAMTADAATAPRRPVILRNVNPPGMVFERGIPRQGRDFIVAVSWGDA